MADSVIENPVTGRIDDETRTAPKRMYRVIEYEYPNTSEGMQCMGRTLNMSIDGSYVAPNLRITACIVSPIYLYDRVLGLIAQKRSEPWLPLDRVGMRPHSRGDSFDGVISGDVSEDDAPDVTFKHVADADESLEPFDWSTHTTFDHSARCSCGPRVDGILVIHQRKLSDDGTPVPVYGAWEDGEQQ